MMKKRMVLTLVLFYSVITFSQVKSGIYRAILFRQDGNQVVFNFEWRREGKKNVIHVLNASERIRVDNIVVKGDSVFIEMPVFEAKVHAAVQKDGSWKGSFVKGTRAIDQSLPFAAYPNQSYRFKADNGNANFNISGRWAVNFADTNFTKNEYAVADFKQIGNRLTGTFLTALGDYRYLEGIVSGNKLYLSCFDGAHNFLFTGYIKNNNTIENGQFCSSGVAKEYWTAKKDDNAALPILEMPVTLLPGETKIDFSFKDVDGKTVSYSDTRFNNKVVIVQIMGSWCPNCMDETNFLSEFYRKNKHKGVEVVALAYEYSTDFSRSQKSVLKFQKRFNVQYPMLITGVSVSDEQRTEKTLPQITPIRTFPTTLVVDKKGNVRVIHNTFFGPGTGDVYTKFVEGFNKTVDGLLAE